MTEVVDWQSTADQRDLVRRAALTLTQGGTVAFPTETVYILAASALRPAAVKRLWQIRQRQPERPLTIAVRGAAEALDWVSDMSTLGRRLARRCWPGPVTLLFKGSAVGIAGRLPETVWPYVCPEGRVGLRASAHPALYDVLRALPEPLVFSGASRDRELPAITAQKVVDDLGDAVDLLLDDGPSRYGQPATVVEVNGEGWSLVSPGVVSEALLRRQTAFLILFVCTGNTCRSPLAEALCKKLLAERLGCTPAELPERGFLVLSAGLAAMMGGGAAPEAIEAARELGADLAEHASRTLGRELARQADCIVAMTQGHLHSVVHQFPDGRDRCRLLAADGSDISDPLGSDLQVYRRCAAEIVRHLDSLVSTWISS